MGIRITVLGTECLRATHAADMAELGHVRVLGVDVDAAKAAALSAGRASFFEPALDDLLPRNIGSGRRLRFTTSVQEAGELGDVHFVCVGTPQRQGGFAADLGAVNGAVEQPARQLSRPALVVGQSPVPVGTAPLLSDRIRALAPAGADAELAWNPEFLREGHAVEDTLHPDRLVIGVESAGADQLLREVYATPLSEGVPIVVTDLATAELTKVAANSFLATKVSGKRIGVLGAAFKPRSDDLRDSPEFNVAAQLQLRGAQVSVHDPKANANARALFPMLRYADDVESAVRDADLVLLLTEWGEFRQLDPEPLGEVVAKRRILDGRNSLDPDRWRAAGWSYRALGRP